MSSTYAQTLNISNYVFTGLFTLEMVLKLFALGFFEYIADSFNVFDGLIVILSFVEIILDVSLPLCLYDCLSSASPDPPHPLPQPPSAPTCYRGH